MAQAWSAWYDFVLPHLPGLLKGAPADFYIKRAAIEFFDRSLAWRVAIPAFNSTLNVGTYTLAAPVANTIIVKVLELRLNGVELDPWTPDQLNAQYGPGRNWRTVTGVPGQWTSEYPNQVTLVPMPTVTTVGGLTGWAAVKPLAAAANIPDELFEEHVQTIADLAIGRAKASMSKPYTDPQGSMQYLAKADADIALTAYYTSKGPGVRRSKTHWI
jgi:hypothetical protein